MQQPFETLMMEATGATALERGEVIQSLWSGYGEVVRYRLFGAGVCNAVLKHVVFPSEMNHPRGWNNDVSHQRKVTSYEVEMHWYRYWSERCDHRCRIPRCYISKTLAEQPVLLLEDLDAAGYSVRKSSLSLADVKRCLRWLAHFHATFMNHEPKYLWAQGTYWHLATRPDELRAMNDDALRDAAPMMDSLLNHCAYKTLVHGDAKVANFCFSVDGNDVAAVDFQYVGGGCGMKDVAYLLGSCLSDKEQKTFEANLLNYYFLVLRSALDERGVDVSHTALEREWRRLFPVAQADFYRFLVGWMPTHWKINDYNKQVTLAVMASL